MDIASYSLAAEAHSRVDSLQADDTVVGSIDNKIKVQALDKFAGDSTVDGSIDNKIKTQVTDVLQGDNTVNGSIEKHIKESVTDIVQGDATVEGSIEKHIADGVGADMTHVKRAIGGFGTTSQVPLVPNVIKAGDSVTIPAGTQMVVNELVVEDDGELIIEDGAELSTIAGGSISQTEMRTARIVNAVDDSVIEINKLARTDVDIMMDLDSLGIILIDRDDGKKYRLFINAGTLDKEEVV